MAIIFDDEVGKVPSKKIVFDDELKPDQIEDKKGLAKKAWDMLSVPEKLSKEGLSKIALNIGTKESPKITGNLLRDIAMNTGAIGAETLAETAPSFISRGSILTAGLAKGLGKAAPLIKRVAKGAGKQLESASGAVPGSLEAAYKDPTLIFSKSKEGAKKLYEAAQKKIPYEETIYKGLTNPQEIVDKAVSFIDNGGKMEPQEAFIARKALDKIKKKLVDDAFHYYRKLFDGIAKSDIDIASADPIHRRGIMAESLRNVLPQNKYGGASPFKAMLATVSRGALLPIVSPAVQGVSATGAGLVSRAVSPFIRNPLIAASLVGNRKILRRSRDNEK